MSERHPEPAPPRETEPTAEEIAAAVALLARVAADRGVLAQVDAATREALQRLAGEVARPGADQRRRLRKALLKAERDARKTRDGALRSQTGIRRLRQAPVFQTPLPPGRADGPPALPAPLEGAGPPPAAAELSEPRKCYVCKAPYRRLHAFYDQLCPACGDENERRRTATADLRGRVALVTGARVKIGYQAAILLLRAGCHVVACTRFPRDAADRYAREPDHAAWRDRLTIHGVDLRHTPSVEALCRRLDATLPRLDFQVHNACQTVRRPPGFYAHLVEREEGAPSALLTQVATDADLLLGGHGSGGGSALDIFPKGILDQDLQQVDLRGHNSWRLALHEVPTLELLEVLLVNAAAPFVMASRLKPLMVRSRVPPIGTATSGDGARHVVMVSAMEGQFYREHKTDKHPHTNMAKAALNMVVRTSAADLARDGIHLNAVDTGWVTDEDPAHLAARKVEEHAFSPPLDIVDGAARILAPIFDGFRTGRHDSGKFYKDYRETPW
jgi:NAD(P)-dependent dehydrogenase (short-subunit alcohol dehydrogenase family)